MAERPAVNASPLIILSRAGLLDLLQLTAPELVVPDAVATEILRRGQSDITAQALGSTAWLSVIQTPPVPDSIQAWDSDKENLPCWRGRTLILELKPFSMTCQRGGALRLTQFRFAGLLDWC